MHVLQLSREGELKIRCTLLVFRHNATMYLPAVETLQSSATASVTAVEPQKAEKQLVTESLEGLPLSVLQRHHESAPRSCCANHQDGLCSEL